MKLLGESPKAAAVALLVAGGGSLLIRQQNKRWKVLTLLLIGTLVAGVLLSGLGRNWLSQWHFLRAQRLASENRGEETIKELEKAVRFSPTNDRYRLSLAQASLALANELVQKENPDEARVESLVRQAIEEGKKACEIAPDKASNWESLGNIYRFLSSVPGARDWAIKSYQKAVELEPNNPRLHELLASVYSAQGKLEKAKAELETALSLVEKGSKSFQRIKSKLEKIK